MVGEIKGGSVSGMTGVRNEIVHFFALGDYHDVCSAFGYWVQDKVNSIESQKLGLFTLGRFDRMNGLRTRQCI